MTEPLYRIVQKDSRETDRLVLEYLPIKEAIEICRRYNQLQEKEGDTHIYYTIELMKKDV